MWGMGDEVGSSCSSLGYGVMEEQGPFRVHSDGNGRAMKVFGGWASLGWGSIWEEWLAAVGEADATPFIHSGGFWKQGLELPVVGIVVS
ncbi:hypothetical protein U1Q18_004524 [Sarracenia purpurea var. burkii]